MAGNDQVMTEEEIRDGYQQSALQLANDFTIHDKRGLWLLSAAELEEQVEARRRVQEHVTKVWEDAKLRGHNPAMDPAWNCVAATRDLALIMQSNAFEVQEDRGCA